MCEATQDLLKQLGEAGVDSQAVLDAVMGVVNETYGGECQSVDADGMNVFWDLGDATELPGMGTEDEVEPEKVEM